MRYSSIYHCSRKPTLKRQVYMDLEIFMDVRVHLYYVWYSFTLWGMFVDLQTPTA